MFSADHPFQLAGLRVRDEDGNLHCAACGRIRGMHPEEETDEPQAEA